VQDVERTNDYTDEETNDYLPSNTSSLQHLHDISS
jgi:hypothetical protein